MSPNSTRQWSRPSDHPATSNEFSALPWRCFKIRFQPLTFNTLWSVWFLLDQTVSDAEVREKGVIRAAFAGLVRFNFHEKYVTITVFIFPNSLFSVRIWVFWKFGAQFLTNTTIQRLVQSPAIRIELRKIESGVNLRSDDQETLSEEFWGHSSSLSPRFCLFDDFGLALNSRSDFGWKYHLWESELICWWFQRIIQISVEKKTRTCTSTGNRWFWLHQHSF